MLKSIVDFFLTIFQLQKYVVNWVIQGTYNEDKCLKAINFYLQVQKKTIIEINT